VIDCEIKLKIEIGLLVFPLGLVVSIIFIIQVITIAILLEIMVQL